jgi:hypothetical protein
VTQRTILQKRLVELEETLPAVRVQNSLMACADRDVALALIGMELSARARVLSHLSTMKAARIVEEIELCERRRVDEQHLVYALNLVLTSIEGDRTVAARRSYVRPRRPRRD